MSIKSMSENVLENVKFRMSSPFLGSFIISWPLINYKLMFVIFGDGKYVEKIKYIESELYNDYKFQNLINIFVFPSLVGLLYTFAYPFFDRWLTKHTIRFDAAKAKMMLVEERKIPFDQNAQAEYFLRYDQDKLDLQKLVKATNDDSQRKSVESKKVAEEIFDRLINQTILLIAVSCGIANEDCAKLKGLIITTDIGDSGNILVVRKFKGYIHYSSLKRVAKEMVNIEVESGTAKRVVTLDWITSLTGVRGAEASSLLEALLAFEIIKLSNYFPLIYFAQDLDTALQINHNFSMMDNISN